MNNGKFTYYDGSLPYVINNMDYLNVTREGGFTNVFAKGKRKHTLLFTAAGQMRYTFFKDGSALLADTGSLCFIPKEQGYTVTYLGEKATVHILQFDVVGGTLPGCFLTPRCIQSSNAAAVMGSICSFALANGAFLAAKIYELLWVMEKQNTPVPEAYAGILPALNALEQRYYENQKVAYYAALCNMSESNFRKRFHACVGKSPIEHRNHLRLLEARKRIQSGEYSVEEAARSVGFHNMSFFYQLYKKFR